MVLCPLCKATGAGCVHEMDRYRVLRCGKCSLYFLNPFPAEEERLRQYTDAQYYAGGSTGYSDYQAQEEPLRRTFRRFLRELRKRGKTGGSLLDIGCGAGYFLEEAKGYFEIRMGTEYSKEASAEAAKRSEGVWTGDVFAVPEDKKFDFITAIQVIEHVFDPSAFVDACLARLKKGGAIILVTPDIGSFWYHLLGRRWPSFKIPEHVIFFNKSTLSRLLSEKGASEIFEVPYPHAFPGGLVGQKLGFRLPAFLEKKNIWIPATSIAVGGTYRAAGNLRRTV